LAALVIPYQGAVLLKRRDGNGLVLQHEANYRKSVMDDCALISRTGPVTALRSQCAVGHRQVRALVLTWAFWPACTFWHR
jgi:hypothetical protein